MIMYKVTCTCCGKVRYWEEEDTVNDTCWQCGGKTAHEPVQVT